MKTAFEMTFIVSGGALNSTQTKSFIFLYSVPGDAAVHIEAYNGSSAQWVFLSQLWTAAFEYVVIQQLFCVGIV